MTKINAKLVALTQPTIDMRIPTGEALIAYCARVSNPSNQDHHGTADKLLKYCIDNKHWSIFEMANAVVEVEAPRDITRQLLRHRSFSFQEFSQRYSDEIEFTKREFRRQDSENRQNSIDDLSTKEDLKYLSGYYAEEGKAVYQKALQSGAAKECARVFLPEGLTMSRLYVNGTLRSWLHYLEVRLDEGTQLEHRIMSSKIKDCLAPAFPTIFNIMENKT